MPTFCRHNRLIQNCPICSAEQHVAMRPIVTSSAPRSTQARERTSEPGTGERAARPASSRGSGSGSGVRVRRIARGSDDGYRSGLVPGLKSSAEAERLADEIAFAATRLELLAVDPPGLYAEVADRSGDPEERLWLAFLIAYAGPLEADDPFAAIEAERTSWASGELPDPDALRGGPRSAHDPSRGTRTLEAYRAWAARSGTQLTALTGETVWTPERRFARAFERLALPGMHRDGRFDLLATLGRLGLAELRAGSLALGGDNRVTVGAKRALGIGDPLLLDRRSADLAAACEVPLDALDLGFFNWEHGERSSGGLPLGTEPDGDILARARAALDA